MEGYLSKGGGKSGTKKGKPSFFRMRSHMLVYYDNQLEPGMPYKSKPKGTIPSSMLVSESRSVSTAPAAMLNVKSDRNMMYSDSSPWTNNFTKLGSCAITIAPRNQNHEIPIMDRKTELFCFVMR